MWKPALAPLVLAVLLHPSAVHAIDNGKGIRPPMGWRSWNLYGENIDQKTMMKIMDGMVAKKRYVDGKLTSLCDLGYCDVGLDDNWQVCGGSPEHNFTYHSDAGFPNVNPERFPDMIQMTNYAHSLNLTAGWYLNNCICRDHCGNGQDHNETDTTCYVGDVAALIEFGFDSVKLDGCSKQRDLSVWADLIEKSGKSILIENCHWGETIPTKDWCPFNYYRTSQDVRASFDSVVGNLLTTVQFAKQNLSTPGCWAYPDGLEVGCANGPGGSSDPGLSPAETRSHFGSWVIVSSPLVISMDVNNDTLMDSIWDIIANTEALAVNQDYFGHSGSPFKQDDATVTLNGLEETFQAPTWMYFYKPLSYSGDKTAVLMMNMANDPQKLTLSFSDIPDFECDGKCSVRDVWERKDMGQYDGQLTLEVGGHDAAFVIIENKN